MNYEEVAHEAQQYIEKIFAIPHETLVYHNLEHTRSVVAAAKQIANHYQLNDRDFFIVEVAAWFHDIGYFDNYDHHEQRSAELATGFLQSKGIEASIIDAIVNCILATRMPQAPKTRLEEIVCDADLFHFGTDDFSKRNKLMRKEAAARKGIDVDKDHWRSDTIRLLEHHHYFTDYCQLLLKDKKQINLLRLKEKAAENSAVQPINEVSTTVQPAPMFPPPVEKKKKEKKDKDNKRPERGIETMFRITSNNNQRLSDMADNKAHIMITVNSIMLSAIISLLLRKLDDNPNLAIPTYLILLVCVLTMIFSIRATRPSLPDGRFTRDDLNNKTVNLLFFGNFYRMNLEEYREGMRMVMDDRDFLYGTLVKDVYSQGVVLGKKYRLLRISYNIFMFGLIASVIAFVIASVSIVR